MLELLKIENGLKKKPNTDGNIFLDDNRYFTNTLFTETINDVTSLTGLPYQKLGNDISVELDQNIVFFVLSDTTVDGITFYNSDEFIDYVFK
jgi:hypothetical protein